MSETQEDNSQQISERIETINETQDLEIRQSPGTEERANQEKGIDVSHWQKKIDWAKVAKAKIKHVCIKMTEGGTYVDPNFVENWNGAKVAGIKVNCYHYFRALDSTPQKQMENIIKNLKVVNFDPAKNVLAIDVEEKYNENATPEKMAESLNALLNLIKNYFAVSRPPVMIYTSYGYWDSKVKWNKYNFNDYPLWVAHWETKDPRLPQPWKNANKTWAWWQYSDKGKVDGISVDVDLDWVKI